MASGSLDLRRSILLSLGLVTCGPGARVVHGDGEDGGGGEDGDGTAVDWPPSPHGTTEVAADSTTTTAASASSESSETGGSPPTPCEGSMPILQTGVRGSVPTGFELCDDGSIHRVGAVTCDHPTSLAPSCSIPDSLCVSDADCIAGPFGRCVDHYEDLAEPVYCHCEYGCASDLDCEADEICACGGEAPGYPTRSTCVAATCTNDDECGDFRCALGVHPFCAVYEVACLSPWDECTSTAECTEPEHCLPHHGQWSCDGACICSSCGRPLLVDGRPVTAAAVSRSDWAPSAGDDELYPLPASARHRIAEHFTRIALLEHASVGSFARFTLELLAVGAPPSLLAASQQAALDEIEHARRCFALAARYAGVAVGPGPLPTSGVAPASTLPEVIAAVIEEGCIGETIAAVEARCALVHATDPAVRRTLEVIAEDEQRHAILGWQTLMWALEIVDVPTRARLLDHLDVALARARRDRPAASVDPDRAWLRAHGVLDPGDLRAARTQALHRVLHPCAAALRDAIGWGLLELPEAMTASARARATSTI